MGKIAFKGYRRLLLATILISVFFASGCSVSTLSEKIFGKTQAQANIPADFVHIDQQDLNKVVTDMINNAKKSIYVEQYQFDRKDLMDLLASRAKQGLDVKVLIDQSARSAKDTYNYLRAHGVNVQYYPTQKGQFLKVKLLSVDGSRALIGGNDWSSNSAVDHDVALELNNKSAFTAASVFARDWKFSTAYDLNLSAPSLPDDHILLATNANILSQVTRQIQAAKTSIKIELPQLTYPPELLTALSDFASSGKTVQVILDASQQKINQNAINELKSAGAQVRQYPADVQHKLSAHFALFDDSVSIVGSVNWTRSSFTYNHELVVIVPSKAVGAKLSQQFEADWQKSKDVGSQAK